MPPPGGPQPSKPWWKGTPAIVAGVVVLLLVIAGIAGAGDDPEGDDVSSSPEAQSEDDEPDEDRDGDGDDEEEVDSTTTTAPTTTEPPSTGPTATAGFTLYEALGETWASVGVVVVGGSDNQGSLELTVTLSDAAGTPLATESTYIGASPSGQEVYATLDIIDNVPGATQVRVDILDSNFLLDSELVPVTVSNFAFDGTFYEVNGTATNNGTEAIEFGTVECVAFRGGAPVAGVRGFLDAMAPGASIAWNASNTFDAAAEEVRCVAYDGF